MERDVAQINSEDLRPYLKGCDFTLLAGCAPCQPFSTYSRSDRRRNTRSDWQLVSEFGRLICDLKPDLVTMENVGQLADHDVFKDFLKTLADYFVAWSAVEFDTWGVPQSRKRLVMLASRHGSRGLELPAPSKAPPTVRDTIWNLPTIGAGECDPHDSLHVASGLSPLNLQRIRASRPGGSWRDWDESLRANCHSKQSGSTYPSVYGRMEWDRAAPTITTQCFGYGNGRFGHPEQDRAISLREAAMLQTFPRDYKFVPPGTPVCFSRLGKLIGNAVPVRAGEVIGSTLTRHVRMLGIQDYPSSSPQ